MSGIIKARISRPRILATIKRGATIAAHISGSRTVVHTGATTVINETPSGAVDGSNATFSVSLDFVPESVEVILNGLSLRPIDDFVTSGVRSVHLVSSPVTGDTITINYQKS